MLRSLSSGTNNMFGFDSQTFIAAEGKSTVSTSKTRAKLITH
jgi:hypothetical protein